MTRSGGAVRPAGSAAVVTTAALLSLVAALLAAPAAAAPWGSPVGKRPVRSGITPAGDSDSFLLHGHAGGKLRVDLRLPGGSALDPVVRLVGPDGGALDAPFETRGSRVRLRRFLLPATGAYEIEVSGAGATTGDFKLAARVSGSSNVRFKGGVAPSGTPYRVPFAAAGGGKLSFRIASRAGAVPPLLRVEDPLGGSVPIPEGVVRGTSRKLRGNGILLPAAEPYGTWHLVFSAPVTPLTDLRVSVNVRGPRAAAVRGRLPDDEPALGGVTPAEAGPGTPLFLTGAGLADGNRGPLAVFVGGKRADIVSSTGDQLVHVTFPSGLTGEVDVAIVNGDGHAAALRRAVMAVPPPQVTAVTPLRGSSAGGASVEVTGTGFRGGTAVTLAGVQFPSRTTFVNEGLLRFTTPPFAAGLQTIGARDPTGQQDDFAQPFDFVPIPIVQTVRPSIVPRLDGEVVTLEGGSLHTGLTVTVDGAEIGGKAAPSSAALELTLPLLDRGPRDIDVRDEFGAGVLLAGGVAAFAFEDGPDLPGADTAIADDMALADYDDDGDLDLFLVSRGGANLAAGSLLRVYEFEQGVFTEVTNDVMPAVTIDDWRGGAIALGDVAGDGGVPAPDGFPDLIVGSTDTTVLGTDRSRTRILTNRSGAGGARVFTDDTGTLMAPKSNVDTWAAEDLWVGDLDGDGGAHEIVATHMQLLTFTSPIAPFNVSFYSATRVFRYVPGSSRFEHETVRLPFKQATQAECESDDCSDDFTPFRGVSLAVADVDADGRKDLAVVSPGIVTVDGVSTSSVQLGRNVEVNGQDRFEDRTGDMPTTLDFLEGDVVLLGDVIGDGGLDVVVVSSAPPPGETALRIVENRGFGTPWILRRNGLLPSVDGDEQLQAHAAELVDVDGDGDLDIVLLTDTAPSANGNGTGRALRILRNRGALGFSRELEPLLPPAAGSEEYDGGVLATGDLDGDGGLVFVLARPTPNGDGAQTRIVRRNAED